MSQRYIVLLHCVFLLLSLFKADCYSLQSHSNSKAKHSHNSGCVHGKVGVLRSIGKRDHRANSSFLRVHDDEATDFYNLKLHEKNFRWSLPLALGSEKSVVDLVLTLGNSSTAFYCHDETKPVSEIDVLGYDLSKSKDLKYVDCKSAECTEIVGANKCLVLDEYFKQLKGYTLRKKNCKSKFCDYVNSMTFLSMNDPAVDKNASVCPFDHKIDSDEIKGFYFNDSFLINKDKKITYDYFGCITENKSLNINADTYGVIGLTNNHQADKKYSSILNSFVSNSTSKKNIFGLCLIEGGGFISFGGHDKAALGPVPPAKEVVDTALDTSDYDDSDLTYKNTLLSVNESDGLIWVDYAGPTTESYKIKVTKINFNVTDDSSEHEINKEFTLDTYDYFISLPREVSTKLTEQINKICKGLGEKCKYIQESGSFHMASEHLGSFPILEFSFGEHKVMVHPQDYIIDNGDNNYKVLVKHAESNGHLGVPFFLNKYIIFDNEQKKLGIAQSKCQTANAFEPTPSTGKVPEKPKVPGEVVVVPGEDKGPGEVIVVPGEDKGPGEHKEPGEVVVVPEDGEDKSFYEKNKTAILAVSGVAISGSIIGSIFYLL
ncbi:aspartyl protease, putative [Plasmodium chabaudi adami]|uniref:Aspartyl protease, putative n=1 Tax=Plasmodium chabaudi adami TaxID=5826 RepID=A0A1C6YQ50_PLACE|nr:aspartyl protease, putative [Plasmodium chabaudi adami]